MLNFSESDKAKPCDATASKRWRMAANDPQEKEKEKEKHEE